MSELVTLRFGPTTITVLCHVGDFGCGGGAWTAVMKIDGHKVLVKLNFEHTTISESDQPVVYRNLCYL